MLRFRLCVCVAVTACLSACIEQKAPSEGQVFAGPINLVLHAEINLKSKAVVVVHHGDKLDVLTQRRRLYRLRAPGGLMGWTDERNLMSVDQMQALSHLEEQARQLPSQGVASAYELLNVHTEPQRYSPSFFQIREGEKFDVIAHQVSSRAEPKRRVLVKPQPKEPRPAKKSDKKRIAPPPAPLPPAPPEDWQELSRERQTMAPEPKAEDEGGAGKDGQPVPTDDWTLVRTAHGTAGWVLTGRLYLAIPDEVAQYAEGHRIVAYFPLGKIHDEERAADKETWLWATVRAGVHPYDFDSFRVFTWNPRRHRYETSYIQRTVEGYLPVLVEHKNGSPAFSVCVANDDGVKVRKKYALVEHLARLIDAQPCVLADPGSLTAPPPTLAIPAPADGKPETLTQKLENKFGSVKKRVLGH